MFTEASTRQFEREAKMLAALRHPNLPRVTDHFLISGQGQYLVMDFVEGEDLNQRLKRLGPQPEADVLRWADDVLNALAYLHKRNIIHRDIKPNNVKITPEGEAVLVDFGIAKEIVDEAGMTTTTGARGLTPGFAPPEQYGAWSGRTDARSDIYAFGATLYVLLTGEAPADALSRMTKPEKYIPLARRPVKVSEVLAQAIDKALELEPENRFQSAEEMKTALKGPGAVARPQAPQPEPQSEPIALDDKTTLSESETVRVSKRGRLPLPILGAGFVGVVALAGLAIFMAFGSGASPAATNTPEATATRQVASPTVMMTNTVAPSKTPVPPTATQAQTAIPPNDTVTLTSMVTNTNTAAPATNTRVATKTPLPTQVVTQQPSPTAPGTTDSLSNIQVVAEGEDFVTISVSYTFASAAEGRIWAQAWGSKADSPSQVSGAVTTVSGADEAKVNRGSGVVEMTMRHTGCPRPTVQVKLIVVYIWWYSGQGYQYTRIPEVRIPYEKTWYGC